MAKTQIQQFIKLKATNIAFVLIFITGMLSSCANFRYTDYGRPFDFLKAKNQHYASHKTKKDTANVFVSNEIEKSPVNYTFEDLPTKLQDTSNTDVAIIISQVEKEDNKTAPNLITQENFIRKTVQNKKKTLGRIVATSNLRHIQKDEIAQTAGWWDDFWEGLWNFFVKWLLLVLAFFVLLALIIWGIYMLITVVAGPIAAGIFLAIVLILFAIIFKM